MRMTAWIWYGMSLCRLYAPILSTADLVEGGVPAEVFVAPIGRASVRYPGARSNPRIPVAARDLVRREPEHHRVGDNGQIDHILEGYVANHPLDRHHPIILQPPFCHLLNAGAVRIDPAERGEEMSAI